MILSTHVWQLGTVESVQSQLIVSGRVVDNDSPVGIERELVVVGNDIRDCSTRVLDLDTSVSGEWRERDRSVVV